MPSAGAWREGECFSHLIARDMRPQRDTFMENAGECDIREAKSGDTSIDQSEDEKPGVLRAGVLKI